MKPTKIKPPQIIGVVLIRNEDLHIRWVLQNILEFCDEIMVLDNYSTDATYEVVKQFARENPKIQLRRWRNANTSQKALRKFYSTNSWVFAVDGDEIFDPTELAKLRLRIDSGELNDFYSISCCYFNCMAVDKTKQTASGYIDINQGMKLYNFSLVKGWENEKRQRCHGVPIFNYPFGRKNYQLQTGSQFDCLHLCFCQRSSGIVKHRLGWIGWRRRRKRLVKPNPSGNPYNARPGPGDTVEYKMKNYAKGEIATLNIANLINNETER